MAEPRLVPRMQWPSYMNVGTPAAPEWELMGEGFTNLEKSVSPQEYTRHYVHEKSERRDVMGYSPEISFSLDMFTGHKTIAKIARVIDLELIGSDAQVQICSVNMYEESTTTPGEYVAYMRNWSIMPDSKGAGVDALQLAGSFAGVGDVIPGTWDDDTKTFTPVA